MKIMTKNKNRDKVFLYSLSASMILHLVILYPRFGQEHKKVELLSKKAGLTFINFTINDDGRSNDFYNLKVNENSNRGKISMEQTGEMQSLTGEREKNRNSRTSPSLSKYPVKKIIKSYKIKILSIIQKMKYYPLTARRMNQEGVVMLKFILKNDGTLAGPVKLVKSCEHEILNRAGVKTIYKSLPFPSFPDTSLNDRIEFNIQLVYNLNLVD